MLVQARLWPHLVGDNEVEAQLIILGQNLIPTATHVQTQLRHRCQRLSCQLLNRYQGRLLVVCPACAPRKHRITGWDADPEVGYQNTTGRGPRNRVGQQTMVGADLNQLPLCDHHLSAALAELCPE